VAYLRLGQLDRAESCLAEAVRLRPQFANTRFTLAQLYKDRGELEGAYETTMQVEVPEPDPDGWGWKKPFQLAEIRRLEAVRCWASNQREGFEHAASQARRLYVAAARHPRIPADRKGDCETYGELLLMVGRERAEAALSRFLQLLHRPSDLADPAQLEQLWALLPAKGIGPQQMADLRRYLLRLAEHLAGADRAFAVRLRELEQATADQLDRVLRGESSR
jgi:tetratricopeptide (TPR) repeat protein